MSERPAVKHLEEKGWGVESGARGEELAKAASVAIAKTWEHS